ncbi:hypothetical protein [Streptomyces sp. NPDC006477]|uniref:hypothetical protein n=1 Tax=Streptomyces sp. NPDC006477 TaxID=3364747 RepID=UPI0036B93C0E
MDVINLLEEVKGEEGKRTMSGRTVHYVIVTGDGVELMKGDGKKDATLHNVPGSSEVIMTAQAVLAIEHSPGGITNFTVLKDRVGQAPRKPEGTS